jgi:ABC-2 type transport system permease protein
MPNVNKYLAFAKASFRIIFVYRAAFAMNMLGMIFYVFAMFYLWQTIFLGSPGALSGFTWPEMKAYLLLAFLLSSMLTWYDEWVMGQDVREGRVAIDLARPIDFQMKRFAEAFGPIPFEITASLSVGIGVAFLFGGIALPSDPARLGLFVISAGLATMIKFGLIYCVSMTAFYTTGLMGVTFGRVAIMNLFSGALIPLVFFPDWLRATAAVLPFQGMVSTPALTYLGMTDMPTTLLMIGIQAVWAVGLLLLGRLIWRGASRAVTINGG